MQESNLELTKKSPVAVVAGWGKYPLVVTDGLRKLGHDVVCIGIRDHVDQRLRSECSAYCEVGMGSLGAAIRFCKRHGVTQATMAGKVHKVQLFRKFFWLKHFPDWECVKTFFPHFVTLSQDRKDDTLLTAVVDAFAKHGIKFAPATEFIPELLIMQHGVLSRRGLSKAERKDIDFGWQLAKEMGRLDVGQSVAVKSQAVMAVEAIEGTDRCIQRAGELCTAGGFTLVKVAKPKQDMRFDVPTIGMGTVRSMVNAGGRVLAIEAGKTIVIDGPEVLEFADRHGITIVSLTADEAERSASDAA